MIRLLSLVMILKISLWILDCNLEPESNVGIPTSTPHQIQSNPRCCRCSNKSKFVVGLRFVAGSDFFLIEDFRNAIGLFLIFIFFW